MKKISTSASTNSIQFKNLLLSACTIAILSACGGSDSTLSNESQTAPLAQIASGITTLQLSDPAALPDAVGMQIAQPLFHVAPIQLAIPEDVDKSGHSNSAFMDPHKQTVPTKLSHLSTKRLTQQKQQSAAMSNDAQSRLSDITLTPMASGSSVSTYTPAQIRTAYGLPLLPAPGTTLSTSQAAQLGAGQTIYIVNAHHNPNVVTELAAFNQKFGLPTCTTKSIAVNAALPLASASTNGCEFIIAYSTASGGMTSTAPKYDSGWATEIAMDVQWAHATAPLARIVLIQSSDASLNSLIGGIKLANAMGPGVVSMSFGALEGSWTASVDSVFTAPNMTYLAATGDSGVAVAWPSVSSNVLAVGGTTLTYSGSGSRSEVAWSGTGGGVSAYTAKPSYQSGSAPGLNILVRRTVADVAFNADPASGQYVAVMSPGSAAPSWISAGGTSISSPQWAGILAIANASRALASKPPLGSPHAMLYNDIGAVSSVYSSAFYDITQGSHGSCGTCSARTGYEQLTGFGTPNVSNLITAMSGVSAPESSTPPVVTPATINGKVGTELSFTASVSAKNPVTFTLTGAPSGMTIDNNGAVKWPTPIAGTYAVTITAKDTKTGLSGQGLYNVVIAAATAPVLTPATINGKVGTALSFTPVVNAANAVTYTLTGAPSGMSISSTGIVSWTSPIAGTYSVTVAAKDSKTGLTGQAVFKVIIEAASAPVAPVAPAAPVVASANINGKVGTALSFTASVTAQNSVSFSMSGAPSGMSINTAGTVSWASPVAGTYAVTITATDSKTGLSGKGTYTVKIDAASGLSVSAAPINGVAGKAVSGAITISASGVSYISITISGAPMGMMFSVSGLTLNATWRNPIAGTYTMNVLVKDSAGRSVQTSIPINITAK